MNHTINSKGIPRDSAHNEFALGAAGCFLLFQIITGLPFDADATAIISARTSLQRALLWGVPCGMIVLGYVLLESRASKGGGAIVRPLLRLTGDASYSLYLTHLPLCMLADTLLPPDAISADLLIVALSIASWGLGVLVYRSIEAPTLAALRRLRPRDGGWRDCLRQPSRQAP